MKFTDFLLTPTVRITVQYFFDVLRLQIGRQNIFITLSCPPQNLSLCYGGIVI